MTSPPGRQSGGNCSKPEVPKDKGEEAAGLGKSTSNVQYFERISFNERMERTFQMLRRSNPGLVEQLALIPPAAARRMLRASSDQLNTLQKAGEHTPK